MEQSLETFQALDPIGYLQKFTSANVRPDQRPLHAARPTTLLPSILTRNTHGSSHIRLGQTQVLTAACLSVGQPAASSPSSGELDVSLTFSPLCGGQYNLQGRLVHSDETGGGMGPVTHSAQSASDAQAVESHVKRAVLNSGVVDWESLCLKPGKAAWKVLLSCVILNHDGNVVDAAILGCIAALKDLRLPRVVFTLDAAGNEVVRILEEKEQEDGKSDLDVETKVNDENGRGFTDGKLELVRLPIPLTIAIFDGKLLVDPTSAEEAVSDGSVTVVVDAASLTEDVDNGTILSLQKMGGVILSTQQLAACVQLAFGRAKEMKELFSSDHES